MIRTKHARGPRPDGWVPVSPGDKHEAFARRRRDGGIVPLICPTCQNVFAGIAQSVHASDRHATLHGVVFDILLEARAASALAAVFPVDDRSMACQAVARAARRGGSAAARPGRRTRLSMGFPELVLNRRSEPQNPHASSV